jgi:23S rRNA pseudouridine1911/1915/1917 synthase
MSNSGTFVLYAADTDDGNRLDTFLAAHLADCPRSQALKWIRKGHVTVDGRISKPAYRVSTGDRIEGTIPEQEASPDRPEPIPLDIRFEDEHLVVVNKAPGIVVHPAPGHKDGTLVNALLHHCPGIRGVGGIGRPGIVHRLDKDTSGLLVAAKTHGAHLELAAQFKDRSVSKTYLALVCGCVKASAGVIDRPISRHRVNRKRMSDANPDGRSAVTRWRIRERFAAATLLELDLMTGRTHQIRVHCVSEGFPLVGDSVYGGRRLRTWRQWVERAFPLLGGHLEVRQMLHAWKLEFRHPASRRKVCFVADLPGDMAALMDAMGRFAPFSETAGGVG